MRFLKNESEGRSQSKGDSVTFGEPVTTTITGSSLEAVSPNLSNGGTFDGDLYEREESLARQMNNDAEDRRKKLRMQNRKKKGPETKAEREAKASELADLLRKSAAFSDILTKKTQVLGRVGSNLDGQTLGQHDLEMAKQPSCMVGGRMRDYQLEGLTWMFEICSQGMSGILADEMGLGKTVQTISLIALLREQEDYLGPHLIVAPLSTLSNWMDEFKKWVPSLPTLMYHGTKPHREELFHQKIIKHIEGGRPTYEFPVVCTSYEMVLRDQANLSKISWEFIIIDEGHRLKNAEARLFRQLMQFPSATRLLITGTPLQNNLKELWSLLHFLLPSIFTDWEAFESWFDFSDLENEQSTEEFIDDEVKQDIVKKIHLILQPLMLRRIKSDVAAYLPKKREYVLFAPMTREQTDLYNVLGNKNIDSRSYLEHKLVEKINPNAVCTQSSCSSRARTTTHSEKNSRKSLALRDSPRKKDAAAHEQEKVSRYPGISSQLMSQNDDAPSGHDRRGSSGTKTIKRRSPPTSVKSASKRARSCQFIQAGARVRRKVVRTYKEADSDEDLMSDREFEATITHEAALNEEKDEDTEEQLTTKEVELNRSLDLARKQIAQKRLGNPLAQLRLACNSPHNFYDPWLWSVDGSIDESIVNASGKMLLLDRLLPALLRDSHKILLFSQFRTQLDILQDYCDLRGWLVCRIDGTVEQDSRRKQIRDFNTDPSYNIFLLSTRAGGQGINLASADTVILYDSDFNPQQDLQAQNRCHRIGQTRPVIVFRLATKGTVEESLLNSADAKRRLEKLVIKKGSYTSLAKKTQSRREGTDDEQFGDGDALDEEILKTLLLKDGLVYEASGDSREILSEVDLQTLCDRSDEAFNRATCGKGDAEGFKVVETGSETIRMARKL